MPRIVATGRSGRMRANKSTEPVRRTMAGRDAMGEAGYFFDAATSALRRLARRLLRRAAVFG